MKFSQFFKCARVIPAGQSVLLRGELGIGKSQAVYQLGEFFELKVVERRLSQISEGDILGLPLLENGVTAFKPPDWYMDCCKNPRILFLDEINRATPEVMQCAFQIILDRELNGHKLHPDTRVYAAINIGTDYQVNQMDPALLDRFWVCDLAPDINDWLIWAKDKNKKNEQNIHPLVVDFIESFGEKFLDPGKIEPDKISPSRRSWQKLSNMLCAADVITKPEEPLFYELSLGMVGAEVAAAFTTHSKDVTKNISAEDILDNWDKMAKKVERLGQERWNICVEKMADYVQKNKIKEEQINNYVKFFIALPMELSLVMWNKLTEKGAEDQTTVWNSVKTHKREVVKRMFDALAHEINDQELAEFESIYDNGANSTKKSKKAKKENDK